MDAISIVRIWPAGLEPIGSLLIIFGIVSIVSGVFTLRRRVWGPAFAGAILALFSPVIVLGILAIVFVAMGKKEFAR